MSRGKSGRPINWPSWDELPVLADAWGVPYWRVLDAWARVMARRERGLMPKELPIGPLFAALDDKSLRQWNGPKRADRYTVGLDEEAWSTLFRVDRASVTRARQANRRGEWMALPLLERWCENAGLVPVEVWGVSYYAACAVRYGRAAGLEPWYARTGVDGVAVAS